MLNFLKAYFATYIRPILSLQPIDYSNERLVSDFSNKETDRLPVVDTTASTITSIDISNVESIRYSAYLLAEKDGFKNPPEHYWNLAEKL